MGLGTGEIILILVVVMVVFGASKLPQLGEGLGRGIKSFKRAVSGANEIEASVRNPDLNVSAQPDKQASAKPTGTAS